MNDLEGDGIQYRINNSGHKELICKKKGKKDEETLSELLNNLDDMIEDISRRHKYTSGENPTESFTGASSIAAGFVADEYDEEDDTSEEIMRKPPVVEWSPKFAGGEYSPQDHQMEKPKGGGVASNKLKHDKVGHYDTEMTNLGKEWPRNHNDTPAMCDVDEDGVEHEPQGTHESTHGEPDDGIQSAVGHDWPKEPKNSGGGVAEPFGGGRWSDGGTLGVSEELTPTTISNLIEGSSVNVQMLFDNYAKQANYICVEDFQQLLDAYDTGVVLDEQYFVSLLAKNKEFVFHEGMDNTGKYWVGQLAETWQKPWEKSKDDNDDDCDDECVEESRRRRGRNITETQVRNPETEAFGPEGTENHLSMDANGLEYEDSDPFMPGDPDDDPDYDTKVGDFNQNQDFGGEDSCPECGEMVGQEESCPACGMQLDMADPFMNNQDDWDPGSDTQLDELDHGWDNPEDEFGDYGGSEEFDGGSEDESFEEEPFEEEYNPRSLNLIREFFSAAKKIVNRRASRDTIGEALQYSWNSRLKNSSVRQMPSNVKKSLKKLMENYPRFNPIKEGSAMDHLGGKGVAKGKAPKTPLLPDSDEDMSDLGEPMNRSQKNSYKETPVVKGTEKGYNGAVKENINRLGCHIRQHLSSSMQGLKGKYTTKFSVLVSENGKNRTPLKSFAEALADLEEILQFHPSKSVFLESYIYKKDQLVRQSKVPMIKIRKRGPIVSEGAMIFRFKRSAQAVAKNLMTEGTVCKLKPHNWGCALFARVNSKTAERAFKNV